MLHSPENSCKKILSSPLSLFSTFYSLFLVLHQLEQLHCISLYHSCLTFLLSLLLLSMLFSGPCSHDLQSLNVVLCLQLADETIICHINSPSPLLYSHTHTHHPFPVWLHSTPPLIILPFFLLPCLFPNACSLKPLSFYSSPPSYLLWYHDGFALPMYL